MLSNKYALQGTNISHPRKRKLIDSKYLDKGDMLVPWTVFQMKRDWNFLVGGFNQSKKNMQPSNWESFPQQSGWTWKIVELPPPSFNFVPVSVECDYIPPLTSTLSSSSMTSSAGAMFSGLGLLWWYSECISGPKDTNLIVSFGGILWTWCVCVQNKKSFGRLVYSH